MGSALQSRSSAQGLGRKTPEEFARVRDSFTYRNSPCTFGGLEGGARHNAHVRDEFLNVQAFRSLPEIRDAADAWLVDYNEVRPHSSLNYLTPKEFVEPLTTQPIPQLPAA